MSKKKWSSEPKPPVTPYSDAARQEIVNAIQPKMDHIPNEYARGYLAREYVARHQLVIDLAYIDMCEGNLAQAIILSKIIYWHMPGTNGKPRLSIEHDGHLWIAKNWGEWHEDCRIPKNTAIRAVEALEKRGLVVRTNIRYENRETPHLRMNWDVFAAKLQAVIDENKSKSAITDHVTLPKMGSQTTQNGYPERVGKSTHAEALDTQNEYPDYPKRVGSIPKMGREATQNGYPPLVDTTDSVLSTNNTKSNTKKYTKLYMRPRVGGRSRAYACARLITRKKYLRNFYHPITIQSTSFYLPAKKIADKTQQDQIATQHESGDSSGNKKPEANASLSPVGKKAQRDEIDTSTTANAVASQQKNAKNNPVVSQPEKTADAVASQPENNAVTSAPLRDEHGNEYIADENAIKGLISGKKAYMLAVSHAWQIKAEYGGFCGILTAFMKGAPSRGKWKEHVLEKAATPAEIIAFKIWYADRARTRGWTQTSLPTAPETIHDRFLNFLADERSYERLVGMGRTKLMEMLQITNQKPTTPEDEAWYAEAARRYEAMQKAAIEKLAKVRKPNGIPEHIKKQLELEEQQRANRR